jgi:penicillin-binding protein 1C
LLYVLFDTLPPDAHAPRRPPPEPPLSSLAPALRRFEDSQLLAAATASRPAILFPPDGAVLDATEAGGPPMPIGLHAGGGAPPFRWFVNGVPLPPPPLGLTLNWSPADPGFDTLSVVDRSGNFATVHVRVQ